MVQDDQSPAVGLIPPLVEETEQDGLYILDGTHRTYLGWLAGKTTFRAIRIKNIRPDCPAAALPTNWEDIVENETVPQDEALKRRYRIPNHLSLRRDFSMINGSKPRQV